MEDLRTRLSILELQAETAVDTQAKISFLESQVENKLPEQIREVASMLVERFSGQELIDCVNMKTAALVSDIYSRLGRKIKQLQSTVETIECTDRRAIPVVTVSAEGLQSICEQPDSDGPSETLHNPVCMGLPYANTCAGHQYLSPCKFWSCGMSRFTQRL